MHVMSYELLCLPEPIDEYRISYDKQLMDVPYTFERPTASLLHHDAYILILPDGWHTHTAWQHGICHSTKACENKGLVK
jgi:hypothetical protein